MLLRVRPGKRQMLTTPDPTYDTINKIHYLNSPKTTQDAAFLKGLINLTKMNFFGNHKLVMGLGRGAVALAL